MDLSWARKRPRVQRHWWRVDWRPIEFRSRLASPAATDSAEHPGNWLRPPRPETTLSTCWPTICVSAKFASSSALRASMTLYGSGIARHLGATRARPADHSAHGFRFKNHPGRGARRQSAAIDHQHIVAAIDEYAYRQALALRFSVPKRSHRYAWAQPASPKSKSSRDCPWAIKSSFSAPMLLTARSASSLVTERTT